MSGKSFFRNFLMLLLLTSLILIFTYASMFLYLACSCIIGVAITYINEEN